MVGSSSERRFLSQEPATGTWASEWSRSLSERDRLLPDLVRCWDGDDDPPVLLPPALVAAELPAWSDDVDSRRGRLMLLLLLPPAEADRSGWGPPDEPTEELEKSCTTESPPIRDGGLLRLLGWPTATSPSSYETGNFRSSPWENPSELDSPPSPNGGARWAARLMDPELPAAAADDDDADGSRRSRPC